MRLRDTLPSQCSLSRCYPITKNSAAEDYVCFSFIAIIVNPISCPLMGTICILIEASLGSLYFSWIKLTLNSDDKEKTRHQIFGRSNECQCNFSWELSALLIKDQLMCWLFDGFSSSPQSRSIPLVFWKRNFNEKNVRSSSCESYKHTILIAWFLSQKLIKSKSLISWHFTFKIFRQIGFEITWMQCKFFCLIFWT